MLSGRRLTGGETFTATYSLTASSEGEARERGEAIAVEQTVEFPVDLIADSTVRDEIIAKVDRVERRADGCFAVTLRFAVEVAGVESTQLLNALFGNASLQAGLRLEALSLPSAVLDRFRGPRFGRAGLRARLGVESRPLLATALKPMGLPVARLAAQAEAFARGGLDIVKDDHGLANQPFGRFDERVARCAEAVARGNEARGHGRTVYAPNVTAPADEIFRRVETAKRRGAGAVMVAPGLIGWDMMRRIADDPAVGLPVLCHPAWLGVLVTSPTSGVDHGIVFGTLPRLFGADITIFPNYGGRFAFSEDDCRRIVRATAVPLGELASIVPAPASGMTLARAREMVAFYGQDVALLIAGDLHRHGDDLAATCERLHLLATTPDS